MYFLFLFKKQILSLKIVYYKNELKKLIFKKRGSFGSSVLLLLPK